MIRFLIPALLLIALPAYGDESPSKTRRLLQIGQPTIGQQNDDGTSNGYVNVSTNLCNKEPAIHANITFSNAKDIDDIYRKIAGGLDRSEQLAEQIEARCKE